MSVSLLRWYPLTSIAALLAVVALEVLWLRTGLFRQRAYWLSMTVILFFMVLVDGWMTKQHDPITIYDPDVLSGVRFPFDIPVEEFAYGVAMLTLAMLLWDRAAGGNREASG